MCTVFWRWGATAHFVFNCLLWGFWSSIWVFLIIKALKEGGWYLLGRAWASTWWILDGKQIQSPCVGDHTCWHAAICPAGSATIATHLLKLPLKLWAGTQGNSSWVWVVKLVMWVIVGLVTQPSDPQHRLIWKWVAVHATNNNFCSLWFLQLWC